MAHFAELELKTDPTGFTTETHLIVKRIVVVGNDIEVNSGTLEDNDMHIDGETWCVNFFNGGTWKQTSYNNNFRKQYAGIGYRYNTIKDKFLAPQLYASWSLDSNDDWQAPVAYPTDRENKSINWDEDNLKWIATDNADPVNNFIWDISTLSWLSA
jgi:hypothetical protein